jgi:hypothetical protein
MALRIEIVPVLYKKGLWRVRIGDLSGSSESHHLTKKELLKKILDKINESFPEN